ncbi:MAG TPA: non-homologous end-joining DNA ligase [Bryobacteraceae bacterium]|jgi:bifunctional non-homologous end joining protein LigD|nr:non-homologous end-joining DNA ligase [Bryobacteraceae bacterium]
MSTQAADWMASLPAELRKRARAGPQPRWIGPMLATLTAEPFSGAGWIFEPKLDGERCLTFVQGGRARLLSRNGKPLNGTYPELVEPLGRQPAGDYIADGEIVAFQDGVTSFAQIQQRMQIRDPAAARSRGVEVFYYLFDLLYLDGRDLRELPLEYRKALLRRAFDFRGPLRFTEHRERDGEAYYRECCRDRLEGMIAKRLDSTYLSRRSRDWLKVKCWNAQEFVIGGYTEPQGKRTGFGALLLGYYEDGRLRYAGKVGTGFNTGILEDLGGRLAAIETPECPFAGETPAERGVHWAQPKLVAQVRFTEWTKDGKLRHPRFLGERADKDAKEIVRERAKGTR